MGDSLKKLVAIVLAASGLLAMTACTPQLSTSETCVELRAITKGMPDDPSDEETKAALKDMEKLAGRASDTLKGTIQDVAFANLERMKPAGEQDTAKIDEAQKRIAAKADTMEAACGEL
jgi:hypothetical protein